MVSRIGSWFSKKMGGKPNQPDDVDEPQAPDVGEGRQQFESFEPQGYKREARFSARGNRGSEKGQRPSNKNDRRASGLVPGSSGGASLNMAAQNRNSNRAGESSPMKKGNTGSRSGSEASYEPGELPPDFHKRVVDLEIKIEMHGVKQDKDNDGQIKLLSDLMQLYSVSV